MTNQVKTFGDPTAVAEAFAAHFAQWIASQDRPKITVALSGGSTPKLLFQCWATRYATSIPWSRIHFFWGDERCVPPMDSDSNYGVAASLFLNPAAVPMTNVHRILGEASPESECSRYETEIREHVETDANGLPRFDMVILGMGDDGHTASIFPHQSEFLRSERICEVATHPTSGQKRITLTGPVINAAHQVAFLVTGQSKAEILAKIIKKSSDSRLYPAAHIAAQHVDFYIDSGAASGL